jgi:GNAT superfamily N-acetyltransferase
MLKQIRSNHFPAALTETITVTSVTASAFYEAAGQISGQIFAPLTSLGLYAPAKTKKSMAQDLAQKIPYEYFVFYNEKEEPVGFSSGCLQDAYTFFMEWSGILPAYQRQGLYSTFLEKLLVYLKELGIERVTSNHMGTNRPVLIAKLKAGFVVTGVTLDERHGMLVWLAHFLESARQQGFERAFSLDSFA